MEIADAISVCAVLALFGLGMYLQFRRSQGITQLHSQRIESFNRLIEKFGDAKDFVEFALSPQGKKLLEDSISARPKPLNRVLRMLQAAIVLIMAGVGLTINGMRLSAAADHSNGMQSLGMGTFALSLGVGLLMVAGVSYFLIRKWRLANGESKDKME
jgi:hypothetical protein